MRSERGMTLVEMLVAMTVFLVVLGSALGTFNAQSKSFRRGTDESAVLQNLRFGSTTVDGEVRIAGSNVPDEQPPLVYASASALAFNADYVSRTVGDISSVYVDPDAPAGQVSALTAAIAVPGSSPAFAYPGKAYMAAAAGGAVLSPAETIAFFFQPDAETPRGDDFVLLRQVNSGTPEPLVRNVLPYPGRPFFGYYYLDIPASGGQTNQPVPANWLPLRHTVVSHAGAADTGTAARIDSLRAIELSYSVTNGRAGAEERIRRISTIIPLPNLGSKKLRTCGHEPLFGQVVTTAGAPGGGIEIRWDPAVDEAGGEEDVLRYVVWRRVNGTVDWGDPVFTISAGTAVYTVLDGGVASGVSYDYAVAAQDCTPSLSAQTLVLGTTAP